MEEDRFYNGPIPEPFHEEREKLRNDLYKVPWGPADQRISQHLRLYKGIEKVEKTSIEAMGGLANAKKQATKAAKEARISKQKQEQKTSARQHRIRDLENVTVGCKVCCSCGSVKVGLGPVISLERGSKSSGVKC